MKKKFRKEINRTGKIQCDICEEKHILCEHHIKGRDIDGYSKPWNLCNICSNCHRLVHEGEIIVEGWLSTSHGKKLYWHHKGESSFSGEDSNPYLIPKN